MSTPLFELCCGSAEDVAAAESGGASRVELNSALFLGGLTPTLGSLLEAKAHTSIPILCMVRPREGGFCYTEGEFNTMLRDAALLLSHGADGIVFGILHPDGTVDAERCRRMLAVIGDKPAVFHRAIDVTPDPLEALDILIDLGFARVLTSGQAPTVPQGVAVIKAMLDHAAGRIEILPGGGIEAWNAAWVMAQTGARQLHAMVHRPADDRSTRGNPAIFFGGAAYPPEDRFLQADPAAIAGFIGQMRG